MNTPSLSCARQFLFEKFQIVRNRIDHYLTTQQQRIALIVLAVWSSLGAIYVCYRCFAYFQTKVEKHETASVALMEGHGEVFPDIPAKESPKKFAIEKPQESLDGEGRKTLPGGEVWIGKFENGLLEGSAQIDFSDGKILTGVFEKGEIKGEVELRFPEGDIWTGEAECLKAKTPLPSIKDDPVLEGFHKLIQPNGDIHEGEFKGGVLEGQGTITCADGSKYEGEFSAGQLKGKGEILFSDGRRHIGIFKNNVLDGQGQKVGAAGEVLEGIFKDGLLEGLGKYTKKDGTVLSVELVNGKLKKISKKEDPKKSPSPSKLIPDDKPTFKTAAETVPMELIFADRQINPQEAQQKSPSNSPPKELQNTDKQLDLMASDNDEANRKTEEVPLIDAESSIVSDLEVTIPEPVKDEIKIMEGEVCKDRKNGRGKITMCNGDFLEGEFKDGLLDCRFGKILFSDGTSHEGPFKEGRLNGLGHVIFPNGDIHSGNFKNGLLEGQGKIEYFDGKVLLGVFHQGKIIGDVNVISPQRRIKPQEDSTIKKSSQSKAKPGFFARLFKDI